MPANGKGWRESKKLRFDWEFFKQSKEFIRVSDERKAFVKKKLELYEQMGYAAFKTGYPQRNKCKAYGKKPAGLSPEIWDDIWRFRINPKIRVMAIFDESPEDEVIGYVLWVDLTHRTGDK